MKALIRKLLAQFGFELCRSGTAIRLARATDRSALRGAVQNGLRVNSVIDIGAAVGSWTRLCLDFFPEARYILVEPLLQYDKPLSLLLKDFPNLTRVKAAAAARVGQSMFFLHEDLYGSSLYRETEGATVDGLPILVETTTIDAIVQQQGLAGPFLLKIDVQGAELQVLEGAAATLPQTEYLVIETSLFEFFKGGPLIHEIIAGLQRYDFVIYDIINPRYRPLDNALGQVDLIFVPDHSQLRREHVYASPQQRQAQTERFKAENESRLVEPRPAGRGE